MKRFLCSICITTVVINFAAFAAEDLEALAGKWLTKKVNEQGDKYSQTIEIKKDKFVFQILGGDDQVILYAEGDVKLEKLAPFSSIRFFHIRAGGSSANLQDIDDEYVSVYVLDSDSWTLASNYDKRREQQKPSTDTYRRVKAPAPAKSAKSA
jgi:hypothetical protein